MEVLRLAAHGLKRPDIVRLSGLSRASVQRRLDEYRDGGLDAVTRWNYKGSSSPLGKHATDLKTHFEKHPPATVAEARRVIEEKTGVRRGLTQVRLFLKKTGLGGSQGPRHPRQSRPGRPKAIPRWDVATPAETGPRGYLAYLWCFVRWVVPTGAGRQRYSVLGALDAVTRTLICQTTTGSVNQQTAAALIWKLREAHPKGPISVILDNARYQHAPFVKMAAAWQKVDLVYLPPYSPNLNLIERVWKFVKKTALANRDFPDFSAFQKSIDSTLDGLASTHKAAMTTLLTHKFETLHPSSIRPA